MGVPSGARTPPCVLRIRNSGSSKRAGAQPMPAFWLRPKRFPEGCWISISGLNGSAPELPGACVRTEAKSVAGLSRTETTETVDTLSLYSGTGRRRPDGRSGFTEALDSHPACSVYYLQSGLSGPLELRLWSRGWHGNGVAHQPTAVSTAGRHVFSRLHVPANSRNRLCGKTQCAKTHLCSVGCMGNILSANRSDP